MPLLPLVPLGEVLTPVSRPEKVDPLKEYSLLGIRLDGQGPFLREKKLGSQIAASTLYRVQEGDFTYSRLFAWRGAFGIIDSSLTDCYVSGEFPVFAAIDNKIDLSYLRYWFRIRSTLEKVEADCTGSTPLTRNRFKEEFFLALQIPLPPLAEQRRIVARIEELAAKIEVARRLRKETLSELEALPTSCLSIASDNLIERYGNRTLGDLLTKEGYGTSVKCSPQRLNGSIPILRIPNIVEEKITLAELKYGNLSLSELEKVKLEEGDILVVRTNGSLDLVGRCAVVPVLKEITGFASYLIRLQVDRSLIDPRFVQKILRLKRKTGELIDFARTTAGQYNVSLGRLRNTKIPVPPLDEQRRIVAYLDGLQSKVDALKQLQEETQKELDALLPSVLDKAFKGEL